MTTLAKIIDAISRNLDRIKTIALLVLLTLFVVSIVRYGCNRSEMEDMVEKITGLNVSNDILRKDLDKRDSLLLVKDHRIQVLNDSLSQSKNRASRLKADYGHLQAEYQRLSDSVLTIPADTSYDFLVDEAYPYPGHLKYPFNEPQVKAIHLTFLEKIKMDEINSKLFEQLAEKDHQLELKDTVGNERKSIYPGYYYQ